MRILIIGGSGFLGWNLSSELKSKYETYSSYFSHPFNIDGVNSVYIDVTDNALLNQKLDSIKPDVIINCSGQTKVAPCEINPDRGFDLNCRTAYNLALFSSSKNIKLIHFSTDLVYSGNEGFYNESDFTKPVNLYGKTKLISEHIVSSIASNYMILRLALLYGWGSPNSDSFIDWMINLHRSNKKIPLFTDQFRSMLWVKDAISVVDLIITNDIKNENINLGGPEKISRYDFGKRFFELFYNNHDCITKKLMCEDDSGHNLGRDCSMDISKLKKITGFCPSSVGEALKTMKEYSIITEQI